MTEFTGTKDFIDVRQVIERVEELRAERDAYNDEIDDTAPDVIDWEDDDPVAAEDLRSLEALLYDLRDNGGDEEWEGAWYPVTLLNDSYFDEAMDELLQDSGELPKELPPYLSIKVDYDLLRMDYSTVEFDDTTFWYR